VNDYIKGVLVGLGYAEAIIDKHCDFNELGPSSDAVNEIHDTITSLVYGSSINAVDAIICMLPIEIPKDMGELPNKPDDETA
jgi:hypothetical protein